MSMHLLITNLTTLNIKYGKKQTLKVRWTRYGHCLSNCANQMSGGHIAK